MHYTAADILGIDYSGQEYRSGIHLSDRERKYSGGTFSLKGSPSAVQGGFSCEFLAISDLTGAPDKVAGCLSLTDCAELRSLQGAPQEVGGFFLENCPVSSLKGGPRAVDRFYRVSKAPVTSFEGAPQIVGKPGLWSMVTFSHCPNLESMVSIYRHFEEIHGALYFDNCPKIAHPLNVFLIKGLRHFGCSSMPQEAVNIFNKYLGQGLERRGLLLCQSELLEKNFDEFSELGG